MTADKLILTPGGQSYPGCGTTGDGYGWAAALGHKVISPRPALVPLRTDAAWLHVLSGITIPDVLVKVMPADCAARPCGSPSSAALAQRRGSFLFTHFGLSGPAVLDVSRAVSGHPGPERLALVCDFLPRMNPDELTRSLPRRARRPESGNSQPSLATGFRNGLPRRSSSGSA